MSVVKNQLIELSIDSITSEGNGVGKYEGQAIFVPLTAPNDKVKVRIGKTAKNYAYGILQEVLHPSENRIEVDCSVYRSCGGCQMRHLSYQAELEQKQAITADCFSRIAKIDLPLLPILPSPIIDGYRNKVQFPVQNDSNGNPCIGFFAPRSHRLIASQNCQLQPSILNEIAQQVCVLMKKYSIPAYNESNHTGLVRHIYLRQGWHSKEILLCLVLNGTSIPHQKDFCNELHNQFSSLVSIVINVNTNKTNVITGKKSITLTGKGFINDIMCNVPVQIGPLSFYQINTPAAEQLYRTAAAFAELKPTDILLDLYCGMGTIGLSMAHQCASLIGVEVVPEAVESAKRNAAAMNLNHTQFICADAGQAATQLARENLHPNVIILDPPRKGCDDATLSAVVKMAPEKIVMISCNPATAARDTQILLQNGYMPTKIQPADFFPRTKHVETVVLLSKGEIDSKKVRVEFSLEDMDMSGFQNDATYGQIKERVLQQTGLKVSSLYIAQIKQKHGIIERENYNKPKSENARQPKCPPKKEAAITEALKYFGMI